MHKEKFSGKLEEGFSELAKMMADVLVEQEPQAGRMLPKQAEKAQLTHQLQKEFITLKRRLENGGKWLSSGLEQVAKEHREIQLTEVSDDLMRLAHYIEELPTHMEVLIGDAERNRSLQEIVGISDSSLEALYKATKHLYEHQHYQEAADCFGVLTLLNPKHALFWIGFGNSEYFCNHFEAALIAYAMAVQADPDEVTPHLYSARCYEQMQQFDNAVNALDIALFLLQEEQSHLKEQVAAEQVRLKHKLIK